mmetsp:Transcript_20622/g.52484  ORF Transcript_20622/g.52484 Transcript_20622/m.52484 type:complete len:209 (+) Transcript_20622:213-839(+)
MTRGPSPVAHKGDAPPLESWTALLAQNCKAGHSLLPHYPRCVRAPPHNHLDRRRAVHPELLEQLEDNVFLGLEPHAAEQHQLLLVGWQPEDGSDFHLQVAHAAARMEAHDRRLWRRSFRAQRLACRRRRRRRQRELHLASRSDSKAELLHGTALMDTEHEGTSRRALAVGLAACPANLVVELRGRGAAQRQVAKALLPDSLAVADGGE